MRKLWNLVSVIICGIILTILCSNEAYAQELDLQNKFIEALQTSGVEYVKARDEIISKGKFALPYLESMKKNPDWTRRILAQAIIGHIEAPQSFRRMEILMLATTARSGSNIMGENMFSLANMFGIDRNTPSEYDRGWLKSLYGDRALQFFTEIAVKGSILHKPIVNLQIPEHDDGRMYSLKEAAQMLDIDDELSRIWLTSYRDKTHKPGVIVKLSAIQTVANSYLRPFKSSVEIDSFYSESARCQALMRLADYSDDSNVFNLLVKTLQSNESTKIRIYAALALGRSGDPKATDILLQTGKDQDKDVRRAAELATQSLEGIIERRNTREAEAALRQLLTK